MLESEEQALKVAAEIGYPVIIKAVAGGGGRGMRVVRTPGEMARAYRTAAREAEAAFGVPDVYVEKYLESPRHIEFQVLGDHHGNVVHLGERECSVQRRHQKLIEESPSPALTDKMRRKMGAVVVDAAKAVQYSNAGTFEFLMDTDGKFYFMEVEHAPPGGTRRHGTRHRHRHREGTDPDGGGRAPGVQAERHHLLRTRHRVPRERRGPGDVRAVAGDASHAFSLPGGPGIRVDTAMYAEATVPPYYDSMIAQDHGLRPRPARSDRRGCAGRSR